MIKERVSLGRVLVIDDDVDMAAVLQSSLEFEGFRAEVGHSLDDMKRLIKQFSFDAVLLDLFLGEETGVEALPYLARESPHSIVIVMTAFGSIELAVKAMGKGATSFVAKTDDPKKIINELRDRLSHRHATGRQTDDELLTGIGLLGQSPAMVSVLRQLERIKDAEATVLISGESGTGKEVIARAIHSLSSRHNGVFAALNCAAVPENLLESELFGHKKGAFTDAKDDRKGIFEICSNGTLLLDEIGEMPLPLQAKLLRVLQEKEVTPVGASKTLKIGTRVLAATNRDLEEEVARGRFREDLFFRLNVLSIELPPLRDRKGDLRLLIDGFIGVFNERYSKKIQPIQRDVLLKLEAYNWPGNVRELQNAVERAVILSPDQVLHIEDILKRKLYKKIDSGSGTGSSDDALHLKYSEAKEGFEKSYLLRILAVSKGSIAEAARISGRYRSDIYRLMERYKINPEDFKV